MHFGGGKLSAIIAQKISRRKKYVDGASKIDKGGEVGIKLMDYIFWAEFF